jgi:ABC-type transport system involved in cytochrome c biogenesis permease subunit
MPHDFSFFKIHDAQYNTNTLIVVFSHYHQNMVFIKKALLTLYVLLIVVMAAATVVEHCSNTPFVSEHIYGAWWFTLLWALLAAGGITYIVKRHVKKWNILLLHLSLLIILLGALLTHLTSFSGTLHLRQGEAVDSYREMMSMTETKSQPLPFVVRLDRFDVVNHPGTTAASDYITRFSIADGKTITHAQVSMNKIFVYHGVRFYQASYDTDNLGSMLSVSSDRWGIPTTYTGYGLLFFSLLWLLIDPKGTFRRSIRQLSHLGGTVNESKENTSQARRSPILTKTILLLLAVPITSHAQTSVPRETADRFGNLLMEYNNRICPAETYALDFVQKIHGDRSYKDYTAEQVLLGWTFYPEDWSGEPFIRIKSSEMRRQLGIGKYASVNAFFRDGEYILGQPAYDYAHGTNKDAFHKACADIDSKLQMMMTLRQGTPFTLYPYTFSHHRTLWFSPFERFPKELPRKDADFIGRTFATLFVVARRGDFATVNSTLDAIAKYQQRNGGNSLPSKSRLTAEKIYNRLPYTTILFMLNLTLGMLTLVFMARRATKATHPLRVLLLLSFLLLTFVLALRWMIAGTIPLGNGYETTLAVAWMAQLFVLIFASTQPADHNGLTLLMCAFGFLISGFFLLVSHISLMDPAIGPLMPVLNSPLLSIHVSFMMMSYAFLAITFFCGLAALMRPCQAEALQVVSRVFLYPAIVTLGIGIFLGAIWANVSWGSYWSWDPKETWALITFMLYAIALHTQSLPRLSRPRAYHIYMVFCFLSILMTYFGVNYLLSGMHSYA